ncbi:MAG: GNAT family N-acetyltransferase [Pyrinomonadaceae bacterium]|nr:GNAT family N-acetyltransferase [Pyrinomonadaceae bacterium]
MTQIRKAVPGDLEAINSFDIFSGDRSLDIERGECFVAVEEEQVAGFVVFNHSFYLRPFIQFLCVATEFRRRSLADKLLEYVEGICDGDRLFTSTESDNLPMLKLFDRRGYRVSGIIENIQERAEVVFCKDVER